MRKIVLAGGSGFLGKVLQRHFTQLGDQVCVLSRGKVEGQDVKMVEWTGDTAGPWINELEGADILINLAGRTVNCRYNDKNKKEIYDSRLKSTRVLGEALRKLENKPRVWLNASSATIYKRSLSRPNDEKTGVIGEGFSVDVCKKWEKAFFDFKIDGVRQVAMRTAMVIGKDGPFLDLMSKIVRARLGGRQGTGNQMVSWLHEEDWIHAIEFLISEVKMEGVVNIAAPNPVPNHRMMQTLRNACGVKIGLPSYTWMVHLGAFFMRTEAELPLKSRYVVPGRLLEAGYKFRFENIEEALMDLIKDKPGPQMKLQQVQA